MAAFHNNSQRFNIEIFKANLSYKYGTLDITKLNEFQLYEVIDIIQEKYFQGWSQNQAEYFKYLDCIFDKCNNRVAEITELKNPLNE